MIFIRVNSDLLDIGIGDQRHEIATSCTTFGLTVEVDLSYWKT